MSYRDHDNLYINEKQYIKKPKFVWSLLSGHLKKHYNKKITFWDVGCANGAFILYLKKKFPKWNFIGSDVKQSLIKRSKEVTKEKIIFDDIEKKKHKLKANILHAAGVHACFDDLENFLNNIISRCEDNGEIYIHGSFNVKPVDVLIRYRDCSKDSFINNPIDQSGWNNFYIVKKKKILKKNKRVKKFQFIKINFPSKIIMKRSKDPMRSWNITYKNENYFINSLNILQHQHFLKIWTK